MSDAAELRRIAVVGAGAMGSGIAQVLARYGCEVTLADPDAAARDRARAAIERRLGRETATGGPGAEPAGGVMARIRFVAGVDQAAGAELAIEAIPEKLELKLALFRELDRVLAPSAILASNTSAISITALAAATGRPERCLGLHFMNPPPVMKLVELVRGLATSDQTVAAARGLLLRIGKTPVEVRDAPGFVSNRVLMPMINEAVFCVMENVAAPEAVDEVMQLGMAHPLGPLRLADLIGLDVCLHILEVLHRDLGDPKFRPCPLLRTMVAAGWLGRKSGRGFYRYPG